jgi:hypothetical protein
MTVDSTKNIPEALLKLKAALEDGKRDEKSPSENAPVKTKAADLKRPIRLRVTPAPSAVAATSKSAPTSAHTPTLTPDATSASTPARKTAPKQERPIPLRQNVRVKAALAWLYETFPQLFKPQDRVPLKIGIMQDIAVWVDAQNANADPAAEAAPIPSKTAIRDAITVYTGSILYQQAILHNDKRYDLDGTEVGIVEEQQKAHADQRNSRIEAAIQAGKERAERRRKFHQQNKPSSE